METPKPYIQKEENGFIVRKFPSDTDKMDLVWHRDKKDRIVKVIQSNKWLFQIDNELPIEMKSGDEIFIPKETYHRTIKGFGDLLIKIKEC